MKPILFNSDATRFDTNGVGRLSDCISCEVTEKRNGAFELTMVYPVTGAHFSEIAHSAIIVAKPSARRSLQAFRIYRITKPLAGRVTVYAQHISYQLNHIPVKPFTAGSVTAALSGLVENAAEDCPFTFTTDVTTAGSFVAPVPGSIRSYLGGQTGSILDLYGGEYEWDNYSVKLLSARGVDNGYTIRYGKNLTDLTQDLNIEQTYTGILPYWKSESVQVVLSEPVYAATAANFPFKRTQVMDFSSPFNNAPTQAELRAYTEEYIRANGIGVPPVNLQIKFVNLPDTEEYRDLAGGNIDLCDKVRVYFEMLGVASEATVIGYTWDALAERYKSIEVGEKKSSLSGTIESQLERLEYVPTTVEVARSIDRATGVLNAGTRGHVVINRNAEGYANEILFLDTDSLTTARNVLRINMNGIGFSSNGYQGPYYQSWTLDGHLALGGVNNAFGHLSILDPSGNPIGQWSKDGIVVDQGVIDLLRNIDGTSKIGLYVNGNEVKIGDFEVNDRYGRQVLESDDEMTGMSGEPTEEGGLYLWAGYQDENTYMLAVNKNDVYIRGKDASGNWHTYALAQTLARLGA